jgi:hypothetical protein
MPAPIPAPSFQFCIPPNPTLGDLRLHAELSLRKLRTGRNIAGIRREVEAYAAATDTVTGMPAVVNGQLNVPAAPAMRPTLYRYSVLVARAKELAQQAAQVESAFLGAALARDEKAYTLHQARQELTLAQAQVRLQSLRLTDASNAVKLAQLQQQRAVIELNTYQEWLNRGLNEHEKVMLEKYSEEAVSKRSGAVEAASIQIAQAVITAAGAGTGAAAAAAGVTAAYAAATQAAVHAGTLAYIERTIKVEELQANHERRVDEWTLHSALAAQDSLIGQQEIVLALDRQDIVQQEKAIAETQASQARDTIEFLGNQFLNLDLFDWMTGVLSEVYRTLLQQATSMAKVAQAQLAFERQEPAPAIIQADYWSVPASTPSAAPGVDRRGLTGSARLIADIYQLDQYAFDTNKRKLAMSKTISLAQLAPGEFQRLRATGVMVFKTPMTMFDRDFPGHYLRLLRRVSASVIAIVPTTEGIRATLSNTGISRVVIGRESFQAVTLRRDPETIALTAPIGSSGVFELDAPADMYLPFEGHGVDSTWEFRLPHAANRFDYRTLSDVLISFDYLALHSSDYQQQVIRELQPSLQADRAFSFRNTFADAWYDLNNAELLAAPARMVVKFRIGRGDFPSNLERIRMQQVMLYFARSDGASMEFAVEHLRLVDPLGNVLTGGAARTIDGTISTRRGNGSSWLPLIGAGAGVGGRAPFGEWELSLRNPNAAEAQQLQDAFKKGQIEDILLVVSYAGDTPPWPA